MKTSQDMRLEAKVSGMILELVEPYVDDMSYSDLQGVVQVLAMNIIKTVKEQ